MTTKRHTKIILISASKLVLTQMLILGEVPMGIKYQYEYQY